MEKNMKRLALPMQMTCLSLAICTQLYAQDVTSDTAQNTAVETQTAVATKMAPIVVTATRSAKSIADIAGTVYSIPKEEIESLTEYYNMAVNDYNKYVGSFKGIVEGIIVNIPEQVEALSKALEEFDPSQLKILNELTSSVVSGK